MSSFLSRWENVIKQLPRVGKEKTVSKEVPAVVGIDPSLSGTAVCVMSADGTFLMERFSSPSAKGLLGRFDRFQGLVNDVYRIIDPLSGTLVFLEGYSMGSKGQGLTAICEYGALLRRMLIRQQENCCGEPPVEVPPSCLKKFATGKGNADKLAVCLAVGKRYGVEFKTNDEFDAYVLARMAGCAAGLWEPENQSQRDALKSISKPQAA